MADADEPSGDGEAAPAPSPAPPPSPPTPAPPSPLRRWLVRVGLGVLVAVGASAAVCSVVLPAYRIPSGSMMPALETGDHILVSRFAYQLGELERGDVIVFRYPVDPSQLFFKRVIGLPGDEVELHGRTVSIERAGAEQLEALPHEPLERPCVDPHDERPVPNCTLYEETVDDKTYVVRYRVNAEERNDPMAPAQVWKVPEGHLFVLGDNRNDSLDSRRWVVPVEAVRADGLLSTKDLRELTDERLFSMDRPASFDGQEADPSHDHVIFRASHRAPDHDVSLEVWRVPGVDAEAELADLEVHPIGWVEHETLRKHDERGEALAMGEDGQTRVALAKLREPSTLVRLSCGTAVCPDEAALARMLGGVLDGLHQRPDPTARELLPRPEGPPSHGMRFESPRDGHDGVWFEATVRGDDHRLSLEVWWRPQAGVAAMVEALQAPLAAAEAAPEPPGALVAEDAAEVAVLVPVPASQTVLSLRCGRGLCPTRDVALALAQRAAEAAVDPANFVDPHAERPLPFVPLEFVVGRAERIYWPPSRWQAVH
jgi:signal peptidase I